MQVDPIKPKSKPPGTTSKRLKLYCDVLLSTSAFKFKLRRCIMAFCRLLKHRGTPFQAKIRDYVNDRGKLNKEVFLKLAMDCGAQLSEAQVDVLYFIFDIDGDGELSPKEFLDVVCRWD